MQEYKSGNTADILSLSAKAVKYNIYIDKNKPSVYLVNTEHVYIVYLSGREGVMDLALCSRPLVRSVCSLGGRSVCPLGGRSVTSPSWQKVSGTVPTCTVPVVGTDCSTVAYSSAVGIDRLV